MTAAFLMLAPNADPLPRTLAECAKPMRAA